MIALSEEKFFNTLNSCGKKSGEEGHYQADHCVVVVYAATTGGAVKGVQFTSCYNVRIMVMIVEQKLNN